MRVGIIILVLMDGGEVKEVDGPVVRLPRVTWSGLVELKLGKNQTNRDSRHYQDRASWSSSKHLHIQKFS